MARAGAARDEPHEALDRRKLVPVLVKSPRLRAYNGARSAARVLDNGSQRHGIGARTGRESRGPASINRVRWRNDYMCANPLPPQKGSGRSARRRAGVVPRGAPASRFDSAQLTTTTGGVSATLPVERADDTERAAVDDVRVDHGGPDVPVAEERLDGSD